ncbi:MAG: hypothetical protein HN494_14265 [Opitutae bacterium]|nr:hypothetical protein [Opitutae bacterium]
MNFKSEQESREERVLALLLDELDADEAKSIEALLAEDVDLKDYRAGLEKTLDLISESARAKADIELEDFKLDSNRRRILEKLWTDKDSDSETEESGKAIRFPHGNESDGKSRSKLSRFLPMAAAAIVTFGAMGVIVSSLIEQAEHEEDMALASEDASGAKEAEGIPVLTDQPEKAREAVARSKEASILVVDANLADQLADNKGRYLTDENDLLALTVVEESDKILNARLVEDVVKLNAEVFSDDDDTVASFKSKDPIVFDQAAGRPGAGRQRSNVSAKSEKLGLRRQAIGDELPDLNVAIDSVARSPSSGSKGSADIDDSSLAVLEKELSETKKSAGTVRSLLAADTIDKRTASASGGVSGAGAGLLIANDESVAVSPKAVLKPKVNPGVPVAAPFAVIASSSLQSKSNQKVDTLATVSDRSSLFRSEIAVTQNAPSVRVIDELSKDISRDAANRSSRENADSDSLNTLGKEISLNHAEAKGKVVEDAPNRVDAPAGSAVPPREEVLGRADYSYKKAAKIKREEEGLENFSSLHEAGAAPGAIAGEKGADKELLAFADFGLGGTDSKNPAAPILPSSNGVPAYSGDGVAEAKVSVTASEGPGGASPPVSGDPTDSSRKGSVADPQAVPDSTLASGPDRWMVWTGLVLLGVVVFTVFRSRGKA